MNQKTETWRRESERLLNRVQALGAEIGMERSFKMLPHSLLPNRFLLGVSKTRLGGDADARIREVGREMDMPDALRLSFEDQTAEADYVHFGLEEEGEALVAKAYLEFYERIETEIKNRTDRAGGPFDLHRGFKWDVRRPSRSVVTDYRWYPMLTVEEIEKRIFSFFEAPGSSPSLAAAAAMLALAGERMPAGEILYLEIGEEGTPRKSFDVNLYGAGLVIAEIYPLLVDACRRYGVSPDAFHRFYLPIREERFGHLSGGTDRQGRDFLTVYYGAKGLRRSAGSTTSTGSKPPVETTVAEQASPVEVRDERAARLFRLVNDLKVPVGFERSFKVFRNRLLPGRLLMGFRREQLGRDGHDRILDVCRRIDMPGDFFQAFRERLPEAQIVLFGFEGGRERSIYKAYLEFGPRFAPPPRPGGIPTEPFPVHKAFKWDASDNSLRVSADYLCFPLFTARDILERIAAEFYPDRRKAPPFTLVEKILHLAHGRLQGEPLLYFEAREPGNPRSSFDINLYVANLRMKELYPLLVDIGKHYALPGGPMHDVYESASPMIFGHLTGGVDRAGRDFLTLYYAERGTTAAGANRS